MPKSDQPPQQRRKIWRVLVLVLVLAVLVVVVRWNGWGVYFEREALQATMRALGWRGVVFFVVAFAAGLLIQVPGIFFYIAALVVYGPVMGTLTGYAGAVVAISVNFAVVRVIGGQPLTDLKRPWAQKILAQLDTHPIRSVALLRMVLLILPPVNYALALSPVRFGHHLCGSMVGLVVPFLVLSTAYSVLFL